MSKLKSKFKKGAASFYIVAFSTLILMIIAISFASVIISEVTRTTNDDLSQSAYDSALAGVEDAKLAYYNYRNCLNNRDEGNCSRIIELMEADATPSCDMVGEILGRPAGEVAIEESSYKTTGAASSNNMQQYYTCVKMQSDLPDYRSTLSSANLLRTIKVKLDEGVSADKVGKVKISWYSDADVSNTGLKSANYKNISSNNVVFPSATSGVSTPPTISIALVQTGLEFSLNDFNTRAGNETNRGMLYLVPTYDRGVAAANNNTHKGSSYSDGTNEIGADAFLKSNDKTVENLPYTVYCENPGTSGREFACSATIKLPKPIGGVRNSDTFMFVVALPYGKPKTDFALELYCTKNGDPNAAADKCYTKVAEDGTLVTAPTDQVSMDGVQILVDSTGRANDLYRRVETRLENMDDYALTVMGPLELFGSGSASGGGTGVLSKDLTVTSEYNFAEQPDDDDWVYGAEDGLEYCVHMQDIDWMSCVNNATTAGAIGQSKRLEAIRISLPSGISGGISYRSKIEGIGWMNWVQNGAVSGTTGQSRRMESIEIKLSGEAANRYNIWYRFYVEGLGWQEWKKNGETANTVDDRKVEAIEVELEAK